MRVNPAVTKRILSGVQADTMFLELLFACNYGKGIHLELCTYNRTRIPTGSWLGTTEKESSGAE
eukprot:13786892-Heterocapsa_arctica.AAC.1